MTKNDKVVSSDVTTRSTRGSMFPTISTYMFGCSEKRQEFNFSKIPHLTAHSGKHKLPNLKPTQLDPTNVDFDKTRRAQTFNRFNHTGMTDSGYGDDLKHGSHSHSYDSQCKRIFNRLDNLPNSQTNLEFEINPCLPSSNPLTSIPNSPFTCGQRTYKELSFLYRSPQIECTKHNMVDIEVDMAIVNGDTPPASRVSPSGVESERDIQPIQSRLFDDSTHESSPLSRLDTTLDTLKFLEGGVNPHNHPPESLRVTR